MCVCVFADLEWLFASLIFNEISLNRINEWSILKIKSNNQKKLFYRPIHPTVFQVWQFNYGHRYNVSKSTSIDRFVHINYSNRFLCSSIFKNNKQRSPAIVQSMCYTDVKYRKTTHFNVKITRNRSNVTNKVQTFFIKILFFSQLIFLSTFQQLLN